MTIPYLLRAVLRRPWNAAASVSAIAIGVAANVAVFNVLKVVVLEPLPFHAPHRLAMVWGRADGVGLTRGLASPANYHDWETTNDVFREMGAYTEQFFNLEPNDGRAERLSGISATPSFLRTLGVRPIAGRSLVPEDAPGESGPTGVLISHGLWQRHYGSDIDVVGTRLTLSGRSALIVGILPPEFFFLNKRIDVVAPMSFTREQIANWRTQRYLTVVARLADDVSFSEAQAEMTVTAARLAEAYPDANGGRTIHLRSLEDETFGTLGRALWLLQGASLCLLLIAAANVGSLQLASSVARSSEFATRVALGGRRRHLVEQLLSESIFIGGVGGALGIAMAALGTELLKTAVPMDVPRLGGAGVDALVLASAIALTIASSVLFGLVPALHVSRMDLHGFIKDGAKSSSSGHRRRVQERLVAAEIAVTLVLMVGAGLMVKSLSRLQAVDPGFQVRGQTVAFDLSLSARYGEPGLRAAFFEELVGRTEELSGVSASGVTSHLPLSGEEGGRRYHLVGDASPGTEDGLHAEFRRVSAGYLTAMEIPLRGGRPLSREDMRASSTPVVVVNEAFARRHGGDEAVQGMQVVIQDGPPIARRIVGVVEDVRHFGMDKPAQPELYVPHVARPWPHMTLVVRFDGAGAGALIELVREEVERLDPSVPVSNVRTMEEYMAASTGRLRFGRNLVGVFGFTALLLSSLGVFGVMSHVVRHRWMEFATRIAVGAERRHILSMVLWDALRIVSWGLVAGIGGAMALTRLLAGTLYAVEPLEPVVLIGVATLLVVTAAAASYLTARRAARVDVLDALRS